jgi:SAM-dependent methyltransferase
MHPVNRLLASIGIRISRTGRLSDVPAPKAFLREYKRQFQQVKKSTAMRVFQEFRYDAGLHPRTYVDFECIFAARHLSQQKPEKLLDIGSYRHFILGLLAGYKVTTIDIRDREAVSANETVLTTDAKQLAIPSSMFAVVVSLCALEHFGLGRYGDEIDLNADRKAVYEMIRVLKPGGALIFSTTITRAAPSIAFNAHRIYTHAMIQDLCRDLQPVEECFISRRLDRFCSLEEVTDAATRWDVYCGCWIKPRWIARRSRARKGRSMRSGT